jgi:hypothetical protein
MGFTMSFHKLKFDADPLSLIGRANRHTVGCSLAGCCSGKAQIKMGCVVGNNHRYE